MKIGSSVAVFSHDGFRRYTKIAETNVNTGLGSEMGCKTEDGGVYYMKPSAEGLRYNAGNRAFWITPA